MRCSERLPLRPSPPGLALLGLALLACGQAEAPAPARHEVDPPAAPDPAPPPAAPPPAAATPVAATPVPAPAPPSRYEPVGPYRADVGRDCDGLPYLSVGTAPGLCLGIALHLESPVIADARGRFRPRTLVQDPRQDGVMWIVDHGARRSNAGRLYRLQHSEAGWVARRILRRLNRPHQGRIGPDGWIYVGEVQRVIAIDPSAEDPASTRVTIIDDLPISLPERAVRFHPLTSFVFAPNWDLVMNMGSGTDRCLEHADDDRCADEQAHTGAIWRYRYLGDRRWATEPQYVAHGLRNSVALASHASGTILQAENGVDFRDPDSPAEELNVIRAGRHYGWPYCFDRGGRDPRWRHSSFSCD